MAKKNDNVNENAEEIIENNEIIKEDEVVIEEEDIISEKEANELKEDEIKEVEATKVTVKAEKTIQEETVKLEILIAFTDKYTDKKYTVGDEIQVNKERADELLKDQRKLVKLASK